MHKTPTRRVRKPRFQHGIGDLRTASPAPISDVLSTLDLSVSEGATRQCESAPSALSVSTTLTDRPDDPTSFLLAATVFCGFPYKRSPLTTILREAQLGSDTHPRIKSLSGANRHKPANPSFCAIYAAVEVTRSLPWIGEIWAAVYEKCTKFSAGRTPCRLSGRPGEPSRPTPPTALQDGVPALARRRPGVSPAG
jgi:hypothetical protein